MASSSGILCGAGIETPSDRHHARVLQQHLSSVVEQEHKVPTLE